MENKSLSLTQTYVRPVARSDLPRMSDIAVEAFREDEIFRYLYPHWQKYPDCWRHATARRMKMRLTQHNLWGIVCVEKSATDRDEEEQHILGSAWFTDVALPPTGLASTSNGKAEQRHWWSFDNKKSIFAAVERRLLSLDAKHETFFQMNWAAEYARFRQWGIWEAEEDCLTPLKGVPHLWLDGMAVALEGQRRGVGSMLVRWGKEEAERQGHLRGIAIPIVLLASPAGKRLYQRQGFKVVAWVGRAYAEKVGLVGGQVFIWDPSHMLIEDAPAGTVDVSGKPVDAVWVNRVLQAAAVVDK